MTKKSRDGTESLVITLFDYPADLIITSQRRIRVVEFNTSFTMVGQLAAHGRERDVDVPTLERLFYYLQQNNVLCQSYATIGGCDG